jgi:hypothetical protein
MEYYHLLLENNDEEKRANGILTETPNEKTVKIYYIYICLILAYFIIQHK